MVRTPMSEEKHELGCPLSGSLTLRSAGGEGNTALSVIQCRKNTYDARAKAEVYTAKILLLTQAPAKTGKEC